MKNRLNREYTLGELLQINWNRIAELSKKRKNYKEKAEMKCRINIQNGFACGWDDKETKKMILFINKERW